MIDNYITGSSGFIGSHLLRKLITLGQHTEPIHHTKITERCILEDGAKVFYLSTYGNLITHDSWVDIFKANVCDVAFLASSNNTGTFVFLSSSSVGLPVQTPYSRCKRAGEEVLMSLKRPYVIIRPFSVTGVGEQDCHLIPKLIHSCFTGEEMPFCPQPTHDWIDVEDVVEGIVILSQKSTGGIFELGTGISWSNEDVLDMVEAETGLKANVRIDKARPYDTADWRSTNPAAYQFGWEVKKGIRTSIKEMVNAYKAKHERASQTVH